MIASVHNPVRCAFETGQTGHHQGQAMRAQAVIDGRKVLALPGKVARQIHLILA